MLFCCKISFVTIYALLLQNIFCRHLPISVWRKMWRIMSNIRYDIGDFLFIYFTSESNFPWLAGAAFICYLLSSPSSFTQFVLPNQPVYIIFLLFNVDLEFLRFIDLPICLAKPTSIYNFFSLNEDLEFLRFIDLQICLAKPTSIYHFFSF